MTKRHTINLFPPFKGGVGRVILYLLTILAGHFVVSACQDDLPNTTEVMMTFTTRAVVSNVETSDAPNEDKMEDLRVIMLRQDGTVVDNHLESDINASSVTFTFTTPITTGGEDFTFLAVANEESIQSTSTIDWLYSQAGDNLLSLLSGIKAQQIGDGSAFDINDGSIPQTKQWTVHVPQQDSHVENQTLDFVAGKISVQFINNTNAEQSLSGIKITGIGSNVYGYLFKQDNSDFVGTQHDASDITFTDVTNLAVGATSDAQTYYTYPIGSLSSPTLYATWNDVQYSLVLEDNQGNALTALNRNDHLQIVVTLTGQELTVNYTIAPWNTDNATNIGSPTTEGGYNVPEWGDGTDVEIGGEDESEEPDTPVVPGEVIWSKTIGITLSNYNESPCSITEDDLQNFDVGNILYIDLKFVSSANQLRIIGTGDYNWKDIPSIKSKYYSSITSLIIEEDTVLECVLTEEDIEYFNVGTISFWGHDITVTQMYIKAPETQ